MEDVLRLERVRLNPNGNSQWNGNMFDMTYTVRRDGINKYSWTKGFCIDGVVFGPSAAEFEA